jgi:hypothetical protein
VTPFIPLEKGLKEEIANGWQTFYKEHQVFRPNFPVFYTNCEVFVLTILLMLQK